LQIFRGGFQGLDDSAASLTNKSGRGRRMREEGKWEKKVKRQKETKWP